MFGSLAVTTADNYTGALVLTVAETWINADSSTGSAGNSPPITRLT
jgi:hypothetical protein